MNNAGNNAGAAVAAAMAGGAGGAPAGGAGGAPAGGAGGAPAGGAGGAPGGYPANLFGNPANMVPTLPLPLDPINDPELHTKMKMIVKQMQHCNLRLPVNQVQQLLMISNDLLVLPRKICDVTDAKIDEIVDQHNRTYSRTNPACVISIDQKEKLKSFAQIFRKLEFQGVDLAAYDVDNVTQDMFDEATRENRLIQAISDSTGTPKIEKYQSDEHFAYWLASTLVVLGNTVGAFATTLAYILGFGDPNQTSSRAQEAARVPEGWKKDQDSKAAFKIVSESLLNSPDGKAILMLYQANQNGISLIEHLRKLNEGEGGQSRTIEKLSAKVQAVYDGKSQNLTFAIFRSVWDLFWMNLANGENVLTDDYKKSAVRKQIHVDPNNTIFWIKVEAAFTDKMVSYSRFMQLVDMAVATADVEKGLGKTAAYRQIQQALRKGGGGGRGFFRGKGRNRGRGGGGGRGGGRGDGDWLTSEDIERLISEHIEPSAMMDDGRVDTGGMDWADLLKTNPRLGKAISLHNNSINKGRRPGRTEDIKELETRSRTDMAKEIATLRAQVKATSPDKTEEKNPKGANTGKGIGG